MNTLKTAFNKLTASNHFAVFLSILFLLKTVSSFQQGNGETYLHMGIEHLIISSVIFFIFKYSFNRKKKYQNAYISTLIIVLVMEHANLNPLSGISIFLFLYLIKFFLNKTKMVFNPVVLAIGLVSMLSFVFPLYLTPTVNFNGVTYLMEMGSLSVALAAIPLTLSILFNGKRMKRQLLSTSYFITAVIGSLLFFSEADLIFTTLTHLFIAAVILIEPKTSPTKPKEQLVMGIGTALFYILLFALHIPNAIVFAVMVSNMGYSVFRKRNEGILRKKDDRIVENKTV